MSTELASPLAPIASVRHYQGEYAKHRHGYAQLLVGLEGRMELDLDGRAEFVDASCALVVPAGAGHAYLADRPVRMCVIDAPADPRLSRPKRIRVPAAWRDLRGAIDMQALVETVGEAGRLLPRRRLSLTSIDDALASRLHEPWPTARLAMLCHMSVPRFHARFLELTGLTPAAYVRERRLDHAERLLRAGWTLEATALQSGYASASALAYAMKRDRARGARAVRRST